MNNQLRLEVGGQTDPGRVRQVNEDRVAGPPEGLDPGVLARKGHLYLVADGMGGYKGGQRATILDGQRTTR